MQNIPKVIIIGDAWQISPYLSRMGVEVEVQVIDEGTATLQNLSCESQMLKLEELIQELNKNVPEVQEAPTKSKLPFYHHRRRY